MEYEITSKNNGLQHSLLANLWRSKGHSDSRGHAVGYTKHYFIQLGKVFTLQKKSMAN